MGKHNAQPAGLDKLPPCAAEFINLVVKKMRYRRKVGAEVAAELAAHFEDALKECKTADEREQEARRLIDDFGDVKLLAILLRRAKKRCRPLWRMLFARACQAVAILLVCFVFYIVWFLTGKPAITTDYLTEWNRIVRPAADESFNAAPLYHKAIELTPKWPDYVVELFSKKPDELTRREKDSIERLLAGSNEVLELVVIGAQKPHYWNEYQTKQGSTELVAVLLPELAEFRKLAYALRWRARLAAEQGRYEDVFTDIVASYRLGRHLKGEKTILEQLVGLAIQSLAVQTLKDIVAGYPVDLAHLAALQRDFEILLDGESFVISFTGEKLFAYDEIQRCFTEDLLGGGHLYIKRLQQINSTIGSDSDFLERVLIKKPLTAPLHILFTHPNKKQTIETVDRYIEFLEKNARKTPATVRKEKLDLTEESVEIVKGNILLEFFIPVYGRMLEMSHRFEVETRATICILALSRYKKDKGSYPEELQQLLAAGYLRELPTDPYSDRPLVYRRDSDDFILYSLGADFDDDGGTPSKWGEDPKGGDQVFWPVHK